MANNEQELQEEKKVKRDEVCLLVNRLVELLKKYSEEQYPEWKADEEKLLEKAKEIQDLLGLSE